MNTLCCRGTMSKRTQQAVYATNKVQKPQELVAIVDEQNNVIGQATRQEMRSQNAIHRCSFTIVSNSKVVAAMELCPPALVQWLLQLHHCSMAAMCWLHVPRRSVWLAKLAMPWLHLPASPAPPCKQ